MEKMVGFSGEDAEKITEKISARLFALAKSTKKRRSKSEIIRDLKKPIAAARTAGYSWSEIAAAFAEEGLPIGTAFLRGVAGVPKASKKKLKDGSAPVGRTLKTTAVGKPEGAAPVVAPASSGAFTIRPDRDKL